MSSLQLCEALRLCSFVRLLWYYNTPFPTAHEFCGSQFAGLLYISRVPCYNTYNFNSFLHLVNPENHFCNEQQKIGDHLTAIGLGLSNVSVCLYVCHTIFRDTVPFKGLSHQFEAGQVVWLHRPAFERCH